MFSGALALQSVEYFLNTSAPRMKLCDVFGIGNE